MAHKKALVITGVSSGIGEALAEYFLQRGYHVYGSVRKLSDSTNLSNAFPQTFVALEMDVTDSDALANAVTQVEQNQNGEPLHGLINNAGISMLGPIVYQPMEEIRKIFEVNAFAALAVSRAFVPLLGGSETAPNRAGRIVNISSVSGGYTVPFLGAYSGSKHALEAFTQALRRELIPEGIHVCAVEPNFIKSKITDDVSSDHVLNQYQDTNLAQAWLAFLRNVQEEFKKADEPIVVARAVEHALESNKPKARYPLHPSWRIGRWLKDQTFDRLMFKGTGMDKFLVKKS